MSNVAQYNEAIEKAAQTAELLLQDLRVLYRETHGVAENVLILSYIEQARNMLNMLNRIAAENILK